MVDRPSHRALSSRAPVAGGGRRPAGRFSLMQAVTATAVIVVLCAAVFVVWKYSAPPPKEAQRPPRRARPDDSEKTDVAARPSAEKSRGASDKRPGAPGNAAETRPRAASLKKPTFTTYPCQIYTSEPDFFVLIDGEPARDAKGNRLVTPCEVGIIAGNHVLSVVREKFRDYSEEVAITGSRSFEIAPEFDPFAEPAGYFASPFAQAPVSEPVALVAPNAGGTAWDPFVSEDSLTLWFAGERDGARGIYESRRASLLDAFGEPELLVRISDRPASPSLTDDRLLLAYTVVGKAQIRSHVRDEASAPFQQRPPLAFSERAGEEWHSARISGDGQTLYSLQKQSDAPLSFVMRRKTRDSKFDGKWAPFDVPGMHACLSRDGLRQYHFDGSKLFRSTRADAAASFSAPEPVGTLKLANFVRREAFRQIAVSDDEQWLFYADDPQENSQLYAVRISDGPGWGWAPRGKPVPQKEIAGTDKGGPPADDAPESDPDEPDGSEPAARDPRTAPLPYVALRADLERALTEYDFEAAERLIGNALADPRYAADRDVLEWDRDDLEHAKGFWRRLEGALSALKSGDLVKAGPIQIEITRYENGVVHGRVRGPGAKDAARPIREFLPADLVQLVDRTVGRGDEPAQLEIAAFVAGSRKASPALIQARLERAGAAGRALGDRLAGRKLHVIEQEIARENIAAALPLIEQLAAGSAKSAAAAKALELREGLYTRTEWKAVGTQKWYEPAPGEHGTTEKLAPGSYLMAPREYGNFVLTLEWKTAVETAHGGAWFRYKGARELRGNAYQIHLAADHAMRDSPDQFSTGALLGIKAPKSNAVRKTGEWNQLELRVEGDRIRAKINGVDVLDARAADTAIGPMGYVCLDGAVGGITYRKILVYELPKAEADPGGAKSKRK